MATHPRCPPVATGRPLPLVLPSPARAIDTPRLAGPSSFRGTIGRERVHGLALAEPSEDIEWSWSMSPSKGQSGGNNSGVAE